MLNIAFCGQSYNTFNTVISEWLREVLFQRDSVSLTLRVTLWSVVFLTSIISIMYFYLLEKLSLSFSCIFLFYNRKTTVVWHDYLNYFNLLFQILIGSLQCTAWAGRIWEEQNWFAGVLGQAIAITLLSHPTGF